MNSTTTPRELHGKRLLGYSLGDLGFTLPNMFTGVYLFQFYVYTINLNALLVSIGVTSQLIVGAIAAIIFGVIIDNKKPGKLGKRRPFLLIGLPVWCITTVLIWFPPLCPQDNSLYIPTTIFFWSVTMVRTIFRALIFNVYISMLPEQSQTLKNREKVASLRSAFSITASVLALLLPSIIESLLSDPRSVKWWQPSGKILLQYIPLIGIIFTIFGLITVIIIFISVDESFHNNDSDLNHERVKIKEAFTRMSIPAKDKNYAKMMIAGFFIGVSGKILGLLVFPFEKYKMGFQESQFFIYILISIFGKFFWFVVWKRILKRNHILKSYSICILIAIIASFVEVFFFFDLQFGVKLIIYIFTWSIVLGSMYAFPLFTIPITASLVHEAAGNGDSDNIDVAMSKISGSYYGLASFVRSMGPAFASMFVGSILSGPNEKNPEVIVILFMSIGVFYLIAFFFVKKVKLSEDSYYNKQIVEKDRILLEEL